MIKIWQEKEALKKEYFLRLVTVNDSATICIVDEGGAMVPGGHVVSINSDGKVQRHFSVNPEAAKAMGLALEPHGRISF